MKMTTKLGIVTTTLFMSLGPSITLANQFHNMIKNMPNNEKNRVFTNALSEEDCGSVTRNYFQGIDKEGRAHYNVLCSNTKSYSIMVRNDSEGSASILSCAMLKDIAGIECFKQWGN